MKLKAFIELGKLDLNGIYFTRDSGAHFYYDFSVTPEDFITFAKADFFKADQRGLVNALSNAKRAIDCEVDSFINSIGLHSDNLASELGPNGIASFSFSRQLTDGPLKFKFLQAIGVATPGIINKMRKMRNLLEHEYKIPKRKDVGDAIDIAELFVHGCAARTKNVTTNFSIGSGVTKARGRRQVAKEFYIQFEEGSPPLFEIHFWDHKKIAKNGTGAEPTIQVKPRDEGFMPLLKLMWHVDYNKDMSEMVKLFLIEIGFQLPVSKFQVRDSYNL